VRFDLLLKFADRRLPGASEPPGDRTTRQCVMNND